MLQDGWLNRQVKSTIQQIGSWPDWMRQQSRFVAESSSNQNSQSVEKPIQPPPKKSDEAANDNG